MPYLSALEMIVMIKRYTNLRILLYFTSRDCIRIDGTTKLDSDIMRPVYMIQPVVKPVEQPVEQLAASCKQTLFNRFDNRLYRVNGV